MFPILLMTFEIDLEFRSFARNDTLILSQLLKIVHYLLCFLLLLFFGFLIDGGHSACVLVDLNTEFLFFFFKRLIYFSFYILEQTYFGMQGFLNGVLFYCM